VFGSEADSAHEFESTLIPKLNLTLNQARRLMNLNPGMNLKKGGGCEFETAWQPTGQPTGIGQPTGQPPGNNHIGT